MATTGRTHLLLLERRPLLSQLHSDHIVNHLLRESAMLTSNPVAVLSNCTTQRLFEAANLLHFSLDLELECLSE